MIGDRAGTSRDPGQGTWPAAAEVRRLRQIPRDEDPEADRGKGEGQVAEKRGMGRE